MKDRKKYCAGRWPIVASVFLVAILKCMTSAYANESQESNALSGIVQVASKPVVNASVTLFATSTTAPVKLAEGKTDDQGIFNLNAVNVPKDSILYLIAKGGSSKVISKQAKNNVALLSVLEKIPSKSIIVNELTTVASAFTASRFFNGESISGNPLGLRIAAGNTPNLVDPTTGGWGKVLIDPYNSTYLTTLANLNTLASLLTASFTIDDDNWLTNFFKASTPPSGVIPRNTLEAIAGIARTPWARPKELFQLFDQAYSHPSDGSPRNAPFLPYLDYAPSDFVLALWFGGGGSYSNGNFVFDEQGNLWSGVNWMAGSQSGVHKNIGGGLIKFSPNGTPLSPPITGFRGMGIDGIGWGTGVTKDKVWVSSFNGAIGIFDFQGRPSAKESDFPFREKISNLMGIGIARNGDVWIAESPDNELIYFPGGRVKDGKIVKVAGLHAPFGIAIDKENRVYVSNSGANTVVRFPADDPSKVETFKVGIGARGVALDSKGNLWVSSLMSPDFPLPKAREGLTIMEQFAILAQALGKLVEENKKTGIVSMIRPDGTQLNPAGFTGNNTIFAPWGVVIDGNDDVFIASGLGRGIVMLAGAESKGHPAGTNPGDLIHFFQGGSIQIPTVGSIDPAGNLWVANNWNSLDAATAVNPFPPTSTWGGGSGFTVIYGVAEPVKPPLMGPVQGY